MKTLGAKGVGAGVTKFTTMSETKIINKYLMEEHFEYLNLENWME